MNSTVLLAIIGMCSNVAIVIVTHWFENLRQRRRATNARVDQLLAMRLQAYGHLAREVAELHHGIEPYFLDKAMRNSNLIFEDVAGKPLKTSLLKYLAHAFGELIRLEERYSLIADDEVLNRLSDLRTAFGKATRIIHQTPDDAIERDHLSSYQRLNATYDKAYYALTEALRKQSGIYALDRATETIRIERKARPERLGRDQEDSPSQQNDER